MAHKPTEEHNAQLQELYRVLDKTYVQGIGDRRLAYYGQLRAQEYSHSEALDIAAEYFHIDRQGD